MLVMTTWAAMFKVEPLRKANWSFVSYREIVSEDVYSLLDLYSYIQRVAILSEALYFYCNNGESLSRTYRKDRYIHICHFYTEALLLCKTRQYSSDIQHRISKPFLGFTLAALKQEAKAPIPITMRLDGIKNVIQDSVLQDVLVQNQNDSIGIKQKILFYVIKRKWTWACFLLCLAQK